MEGNKVIAVSEDLFTDIIVLVGTLDQIQDRVKVNKQMNVFQKKTLLNNQKKTKEVLLELEKVCNSL